MPYPLSTINDSTSAGGFVPYGIDVGDASHYNSTDNENQY